MKSLNEALEIQSAKGTLVDRGLTIQDIAQVLESQGEYDKAIEHHLKAKSLFQEAGWITLESLSLGTIASIYRNFIGDNQKALLYTEEVLKLDYKAGDKEQEASTLNQQADIYVLQGNYQLALDRYNQALKIERSITINPKAEARTLRNIASVYQHLGDYKSSIDTYNKALDIYRNLDSKSQQARTLLYMGGVYQANAKFEGASQFGKNTLAIGNRVYTNKVHLRGLSTKSAQADLDCIAPEFYSEGNMPNWDAPQSKATTNSTSTC